MPTEQETRDKLAADLKIVEEGVAAGLAYIRHLATDLRQRMGEVDKRLIDSEAEFKQLDHRLSSIRMGILGLYDKRDAEDAKRKP